jgi:hypothetical protein
MLGSLGPRPGLRRTGGFPPLRAAWRGQRVDRCRLDAFLRLSGLSAAGGVPILYLHALGFRLLMAILTQRSFPLPIRAALQIRNHLLQRRPVAAGALLDLESCVAGQRILEKGAEVDLHTAARAEGEVAWESLVTFYYRGRHGEAGAPSALARLPDLAGAREVAAWRAPRGGGWRLGRLTGDYNPLHWARLYPRLLGYRGAFHQPPLVLGQCLARLPAPPGGAQRLDAWLKGPVYFDSGVRLRASTDAQGAAFALVAGGEERPAIVGRWRAAGAEERLADDAAGGDASSR